MQSHQINQIIFFVILIALSAFFSAAETAYRSVNTIQLRHKAEDGNKKAQTALNLLENRATLLSTILIGNNLADVSAAVIAARFFLDLFPTYGTLIAIACTALFVLLLGEIMPKLMGKVYADTIAIHFSPILNFFMKLFSPFNWLLQKWQVLVNYIVPMPEEERISEEELLTLVDEAHLDGSIEVEEHQLVKAAIEFDDRDIASILTPRVDVVGFDINETLEEIEELYLRTPFSRLIVYEETTDYILGTLHAKDFYRYMKAKNKNNDFTYQSIEELLTKPLFVPLSISPSDLLQAMQNAHTHVGIITDGFRIT
jgi:Mg2+/Co2+ transporter CorB